MMQVEPSICVSFDPRPTGDEHLRPSIDINVEVARHCRGVAHIPLSYEI